MASVASKNLYELLGNDPELDPARKQPDVPTKVMDKPVARTGKRNAAAEAPVKDAAAAAPRPAGRRQNVTGSEQAFRDRNAGAANNRSKPTDDGVRQDRHSNRVREAGEHRGNTTGGRGARGGRPFGGRGGTRTARDDKHDRTGHAGPNDHAKQAGAAWGQETGDAELADETAGLADARAEEKKEGVVADETPVDAEGNPVTELPAEGENVKSYEQYLAEQLEKKAALAGNFEVRKPNEGAAKKFPEGKVANRAESEDFIAGAGGKEKKQKERKTKQTLDIDQAWREEQAASNESGFRGGRGGDRPRGDRPRGGRGGARGGPRGGASTGAPRGGAPRGGAPRGGARSAAPVNVTSSSDFPSLGA